MQRREQYLLIGLVAAVVLWQGARMLNSAFLEPLREKQAALEKLESSIELGKKDLVLLARQSKNLGDWKKRSLPPDPVKSTKQRPSALNAQRLYGDWLHDLAQLSGFEDLKVSPDVMTVSRDNVFVSVHIKLEADARFEQLCRFLDRFYRTDLLHRVTALRVQSQESDGDPAMQIQMDIEGVAIANAPQTRRLFAHTTLVDEMTEDSTEMIVESSEEFPKDPGFLVRLKNEIVKVTKVEGAIWSVERAQDSTSASSHQPETIVEHVRLNRDVAARSSDEIKQLLESNIFVKPAPPIQYKPRIAPLGEKSFTRGRPFEFNVVAMGYDPAKGRPEFSLVPPLIAGARLEKSTGKFTWSPTTSQKAGKYTFKFEVKHPSAPGGKLSESVNIQLRDPNTPPKISPASPPIIYLGRPWKYTMQATDAETQGSKLTWKLGETAPMGLSIESQTGVLTWTTDDSTEPGTVNVSVIVTDDGTPPQSTTLPLRLTVQDDAAMFTYLTTIFAVNGNVIAKLYDRSTDKYTELKVGTRFAVADIDGTVTKIEKKYLLFENPAGLHRLIIGNSLRELTTEKRSAAPEMESEIPDATKPANVVPKTAEQTPVEAQP